MQLSRAAQVLQPWTSCATAPPLSLTVPHKKCLHAVHAEPHADSAFHASHRHAV